MYQDQELYLISKMSKEEFINWVVLVARNKSKQILVERMETPIKSYFNPEAMTYNLIFNDSSLIQNSIDIIQNEIEISKEIHKTFK